MEVTKCPSTDELIKKLWYIYTMEYYSGIKKWNYAICNIMDGPRDYVKWSKSDSEKQISYDITYMWNLKHKWNYLQNRNRLTDIKN